MAVPWAVIAEGANRTTGAALGGLSAWESNKNNRAAASKARSAVSSASDISDANTSKLMQLLYGNQENLESALGGDETINNYVSGVKNYDPSSYTTDTSSADYSFDKDVSAYMDPAVDYRISESNNAIENSLAGQGNLFSGGAGLSLSANASEMASDEYDKAYNKWSGDRTFDYQKYTDQISQEQKNNEILNSGEMSKLGLEGDLSGTLINSRNDTLSSVASTMNADTANKIQLALSEAGIDMTEGANKQSIFGGILSGFSSAG